MARFELYRTVHRTPAECWDRLTDWPRHGERVPLTRVFVSKGSGREVGDVVTARTSVGPLGFDDPMEILLFQAPEPGRPGLGRLVKHGSVVRGWAELSIVASETDAAKTVVGWREEIAVLGIPRLADPLLARAGRVVFGRVVERLVR
ncbi:SRPBCC family protein [Streptacidiphilus sp. N1-12]|uniref:SRPBCC family protein n=2 Tax=Streptacidiphilus alkalitolerans TaxID=3342712 RepID=A0ABV6XE32_9ACTN